MEWDDAQDQDDDLDNGDRNENHTFDESPPVCPQPNCKLKDLRHRAKYFHPKAICPIPNCSINDPIHRRQYAHNLPTIPVDLKERNLDQVKQICPDGLGCPQRTTEPHASQLHHPVGYCPEQTACRYWQRPHQEEPQSEAEKRRIHILTYTHPCRYYGDCRTSEAHHFALFVHPCPTGKACQKFNIPQHAWNFTHPCTYGIACVTRDSPQHYAQYRHPCQQPCIDASLTHSIRYGIMLFFSSWFFFYYYYSFLFFAPRVTRSVHSYIHPCPDPKAECSNKPGHLQMFSHEDVKVPSSLPSKSSTSSANSVCHNHPCMDFLSDINHARAYAHNNHIFQGNATLSCFTSG